MPVMSEDRAVAPLTSRAGPPQKHLNVSGSLSTASSTRAKRRCEQRCEQRCGSRGCRTSLVRRRAAPAARGAAPGWEAGAPRCVPAPQETCPISTGGGTRRVQSVREGGRGGPRCKRSEPPESRRPLQSPTPTGLYVQSGRTGRRIRFMVKRFAPPPRTNRTRISSPHPSVVLQLRLRAAAVHHAYQPARRAAPSWRNSTHKGHFRNPSIFPL